MHLDAVCRCWAPCAAEAAKLQEEVAGLHDPQIKRLTIIYGTGVLPAFQDPSLAGPSNTLSRSAYPSDGLCASVATGLHVRAGQLVQKASQNVI